ncbi:uncharacterized protein LOC122230576 [Panthera tigris]|uniref:uncharacterized protein LOC122230576 n=1 Tax=Panthera tigris TaxID=9694 RepID=UPI001C6FB1E5|nr:uncharacterized protein LOC122230576 [Panthera tigris]
MDKINESTDLCFPTPSGTILARFFNNHLYCLLLKGTKPELTMNCKLSYNGAYRGARWTCGGSRTRLQQEIILITDSYACELEFYVESHRGYHRTFHCHVSLGPFLFTIASQTLLADDFESFEEYCPRICHCSEESWFSSLENDRINEDLCPSRHPSASLQWSLWGWIRDGLIYFPHCQTATCNILLTESVRHRVNTRQLKMPLKEQKHKH